MSSECIYADYVKPVQIGSKNWNESVGAEATNADPCVYHLNKGSDLVLITIYVNDIWISCRNIEVISNLKNTFSRLFDLKDIGNVSYCLGILKCLNLSQLVPRWLPILSWWKPRNFMQIKNWKYLIGGW